MKDANLHHGQQPTGERIPHAGAALRHQRSQLAILGERAKEQEQGQGQREQHRCPRLQGLNIDLSPA